MQDRARITGKITATVYRADGSVKRREPGFFRRLFGLEGSPMISINHNIVTNEGDALIADLMSNTPARVKVDNGNGHIEVGTGWSGVTPKSNTSCNSPTGSPKQLSATYPKVKGAFLATDDNVTLYRSVFIAGDLSATDIDEVALVNNSNALSADCLAYAEITPKVTVGSLDTLQIDWELTFLGA